MKQLIIFICFMGLLSCSKTRDKAYCQRKIQRVTGVTLSLERFQLIEHSSSVAIGDKVETFTLRVEEDEFNRFILKLKNHEVLETINDSIFQFSREKHTNILMNSSSKKIKYVEADL